VGKVDRYTYRVTYWSYSMPFSFGSKIALKSAGNLVPSDTKYYGFTTISTHEDLTNSDAPLYYIPSLDNWNAAASGAADDRLQIIQKTDIIDLYVIGEGEDGTCGATQSACTESCYDPTSPDGIKCCGANCQFPNFCSCGACQDETECCGKGTYATGGYGIPYHIRIDVSGIDEDKWPTGTPAILAIQQFTASSFPGVNDVGRSIIVKVIKDSYEFGVITITDAGVVPGGYIYEISTCDTPCLNCDDIVCSCLNVGFGNPINSTLSATSNYGISITSTAYGGPVSDGTLENIFYTNFGWSGLTGITWNNYGTGGSGCYYSQQTGDEPCVLVHGEYEGAPGRILGVAINAPFEP